MDACIIVVFLVHGKAKHKGMRAFVLLKPVLQYVILNLSGRVLNLHFELLVVDAFRFIINVMQVSFERNIVVM